MAVALCTDQCLRINGDNKKHELKSRFFVMWNLHFIRGPDTSIFLGKKCFERYFLYYFHIYIKLCLLLWLKSRSARGASHNPVFMGNCPTIGQTFLALSTQLMSFPLRKWRRDVSPRYHLILLCLVWIKRMRRQEELSPVWGKRGEGVTWLSVCRAPFDNVLLCQLCWFLLKRALSMILNLWGVGSILRNGCGNQGRKVCCIAPGEWKVSRVVLQAYGISYRFL